MSRCAIYVRVSTDEQNPYSQEEILTKWAGDLGMSVYEVFTDICSGGDSNRPQFKQMCEAARIGQFNSLLIWSLDRLSREGIQQTRAYLNRLRSYNVNIMSYTEPWLDTMRGDGVYQEMVYDILIGVYASLARAEREKISDNTKRGIKNNPNVGKRGKDKRKRKPRSDRGKRRN